MRIAFYCKCGVVARGRAEPDHAAKRIIEVFGREHSGPGHGRCDVKTARRARALAVQNETLGRAE